MFLVWLHNIHQGFTSWGPELSGLQPWLLQSDQDLLCNVGLHPTLGVEKSGLVCSEPLRGTDVWGADCYFHPLSMLNQFKLRPEIKGDYPLNLTILIRGGKENNCDSLSNGE